MAVAAGTVTVGSNAAVLIVPAANPQTADGSYPPNAPGLRTTITNVGSQAVFLGPASVTGSTNGYQLAINQSVVVDLAYIDAVYGIALGGAQSVSWIQGWQ